MEDAISMSVYTMTDKRLTAIDNHRIFSWLFFCPLLSSSEIDVNEIDADERLPGHIRNPHSPSFESEISHAEKVGFAKERDPNNEIWSDSHVS